MSERSDGFISVVHSHTNTSTRELEDLISLLLCTTVRRKHHLELTWLSDLFIYIYLYVYHKISGLVLITECVSTDNDGFGPPWYQPGDILDQDWLPEDSTIQDVTNCSVGGLPHLFKLELNNTSLIWSAIIYVYDSYIVAHLIPTLHYLIASAAFNVTSSLVRSLFSIPKSKYRIGRSRKGVMR